MRLVDTQALLDVWDMGHAQCQEQWALTMLALSKPASSADALAELSIGQRDAALLAWRNVLFGRKLGVVEQCPRCREQLEINLDATELLLPVMPPTAADFVLSSEGVTVRFRLPNSLDLLAAIGCANVDAAQTLLLGRCVIETHRDEERNACATLSPAVVSALSDRMSELDPQADLRLSLRCSACLHDWKVVFDILPFLWCELNAWALHLLHEVHRIAAAYGWAEDKILSMSAARRRRYLAMLGG
jgi:uncharacterized metal-binding protein YceD (DUF177 family)